PDGSRGRKIILPGTFRPDPTIVVIRDTSGSMSDTELGEVGREITEIAQRCGVHEDRVFVLDVDAAVYRARALSETGVLHSASGGGGTDMRLGLAAVPELFDKDPEDRKSTRLNSSHVSISYAVFCFRRPPLPPRFPYTPLFRSSPRSPSAAASMRTGCSSWTWMLPCTGHVPCLRPACCTRPPGAEAPICGWVWRLFPSCSTRTPSWSSSPPTGAPTGRRPPRRSRWSP